MTNYADLEALRDGVYFESATQDSRFVWEEISPPDPSVAEVIGGVWFDGFRRFRLLDCAHRDEDRDGDLCTHCGYAFPAPEKKAASRKSTSK